MGKRSSFKRIPRDFYATPHAAVPPLILHLRGVRSFAEPCGGEGALVGDLEANALRCVYAGDIRTGHDALELDQYGAADCIITNPPTGSPDGVGTYITKGKRELASGRSDQCPTIAIPCLELELAVAAEKMFGDGARPGIH